MSHFIRKLYHIFIKNAFIRWTWMLALVLVGVRFATERGLAWKKTPLSKTVVAIPSASISTFTIKQGEEDETIFTLGDTCWFAVKNNVTLRLPFDSIQPFLSIFEKMDAINVNVLNEKEFELLYKKPHTDITISQVNNKNHSFSLFYTDRDSFTNNLVTYIKLPNENALQGIKGDLLSIFNKNFDNFRDKTVLNINSHSLLSLTFLSPTDTFSFTHRNGNWVSNKNANRFLQNDFQLYLKNLLILRGAKFYDGDRDILSTPKIQNQLIVYLPSDTIVLTNYKLEKGYILHSTQNKEAFFKFESTEQLFPSLSNFFLIK